MSCRRVASTVRVICASIWDRTSSGRSVLFEVEAQALARGPRAQTNTSVFAVWRDSKHIWYSGVGVHPLDRGYSERVT